MRLLVARYLSDLAMNGNGKPIQDLAAEAGLSASYFARIFRPSFLAPEIIKAIIQGHQPVMQEPGEQSGGSTAIRLMRAGQLKLSWPDQRRQLDFD